MLCPHRGMGKKGDKGKKQFDDGSDEDMDEDEDDDGGLSDEEVDFGDDEDNDLAEEFRREMEGLGKEEDKDDEDDDEDEDFSGGKKLESSCSCFCFVFVVCLCWIWESSCFQLGVEGKTRNVNAQWIYFLVFLLQFFQGSEVLLLRWIVVFVLFSVFLFFICLGVYFVTAV